MVPRPVKAADIFRAVGKKIPRSLIIKRSRA
jgi:hypothetical protein